MHGQEHGAPSLVEAPGDQRHQAQAQQQRRGRQEAIAFREFTTVGPQRRRLGPSLGLCLGQAAHSEREQWRGHGEGRGIYQQDVLGSEYGDQHTSESGCRQRRTACRTVVQPGGPGQRHSCAFGERGQQDAASGSTRRTEQPCQRHQHAQHPELQDVGELQQRDRRNRDPAGEIRGDAHPPSAHPVDDRTADERSEHCGQQCAERHDPGLGGTARALQHEPRHAHVREAIPCDRNEVGGKNCCQRTAINRPEVFGHYGGLP